MLTRYEPGAYARHAATVTVPGRPRAMGGPRVGRTMPPDPGHHPMACLPEPIAGERRHFKGRSRRPGHERSGGGGAILVPGKARPLRVQSFRPAAEAYRNRPLAVSPGVREQGDRAEAERPVATLAGSVISSRTSATATLRVPVGDEGDRDPIAWSSPTYARLASWRRPLTLRGGSQRSGFLRTLGSARQALGLTMWSTVAGSAGATPGIASASPSPCAGAGLAWWPHRSDEPSRFISNDGDRRGRCAGGHGHDRRSGQHLACASCAACRRATDHRVSGRRGEA